MHISRLWTAKANSHANVRVMLSGYTSSEFNITYANRAAKFAALFLSSINFIAR